MDDGAPIIAAPELPIAPWPMSPADGMSDIELTPPGNRGRDIPAPPPEGIPPPMLSMFWARKIGFGHPTAPTRASADRLRDVSSTPCVPIGIPAPPPVDPPPLAPPAGIRTRRTESMCA